ncbi:MAG: Xaa-Pro peptidase family protein [Pseudomonadota bacterium]
MVSRAEGVFTRDEYRRRAALTKAAMAEKGIDLLFVVEQSNLIWLTGYLAQSAYVEQSAVVDPNADEPMLCVRQQDFPAAVHLSYMDRARVIGFPERLIANPDENGYDHMVAWLRDAGLISGRIGVEMGELSATAVNHLRRIMDGASLVDATGLVTWLRLQKSDEEIVVMREAAAISDAAMGAAVERISAGVHERDAVRAAVDTLIAGTDGVAGTQFHSVNFCTTPLTGTSHIHWSDHVYGPGSQVNIELGGTRYAYCSGLMRTVHVGDPPDRLKRLHEAQVEGLAAGLNAAKVGNTAADVANAFHSAINRHGFAKVSRCGYAIGINWTETSASLKPEDKTVLRPNMTFHLMLGNWIDEDFGYVISETFRVTEQCGEALGNFPRDLFIK